MAVWDVRALNAVRADEAAAARAGVLHGDLLAATSQARRRTRSGAWSQHGPVVVMHNGPMTDDQRAWVAVLRCGEGAVLAATWAMREHGIAVERSPRPQVVVPAFRSTPRVPGVDVRRSRLLDVRHVHPAHQPPVLRLARATLDATSLCRHPDDCRSLLCAPVQQRRLRVSDLRASLSGLGPLPGRSLVLRTLDDLELGAQSIHEQRFLRGIRRHRICRPDAQVLRLRTDGRAYLDFWWELYQLHVEIDGLAHLWVDNWLADLERANELEIAGTATRLRFAGFQLLEREDWVFEQVTRALAGRGWSGGPT